MTIRQYNTGIFALLKQDYYCANTFHNFLSHGVVWPKNYIDQNS